MATEVTRREVQVMDRIVEVVVHAAVRCVEVGSVGVAQGVLEAGAAGNGRDCGNNASRQMPKVTAGGQVSPAGCIGANTHLSWAEGWGDSLPAVNPVMK